jgi:hypothetical protein
MDLIAGATRPKPPGAEAGGKGDVAATIPEGPIPDGVAFSKPMTPLKCWDDKGFQRDAAVCDSLEDLKALFEKRLYIVDECRKEQSEYANTGTLTLGMEADFLKDVVSFWPGKVSTVRYADEIVACVSDRMQGLSLAGLQHRFTRYHLGAAVKFSLKKPAQVIVSSETGASVTVPARDSEEIAASLKDAVEMAVTRERMRVRKAPLDGEIIGFISAPHKVRLIEQAGDWCMVKTKRGNIGWMACWGLGIGPGPGK